MVTSMTHSQLFMVRPQTKQRPRMTRRGRAYTPQKTHNYEQALRDMYTGPLYGSDDRLVVSIKFDTNCLMVDIDFAENTDDYTHFWDRPPIRNVHMRTADLDNLSKAVLDGLQSQKETDKRVYQAGAWDDDRIVYGLQAMFCDLSDLELAA